MISSVSQNLVNVVQTLSSRDLDKTLSFDLHDGQFKVDRHTIAGSKSLSERTFITADQHLTESGEQNAFVRMQVANALRVFTNGAAATEPQRAFFREALRELLGMDGVEGSISPQVACRPLAMRTVKQLLTKAERLFALSEMAAATTKAADTAADLTVRLNETAALNGKGKVATKLVDDLERDLAALGVKLAKAQTEEERVTIRSDVGARLNVFNVTVSQTLAKMTSLEAVAQDAIAKYAARNGGSRLGELAQMRFIGFFARTQLEPGMKVKDFRTKLLAALPGFVAGLETPPPIAGTKFTDAHVKPAAFMEAERQTRELEAKDQTKVSEGKNVTVPKRFELGADAFNADVFLRGGPAVDADYVDAAGGCLEELAARSDVRGFSVALGARTVNVDFAVPRERLCKANFVSGCVMDLCMGNRLQAAGVLFALNQRVDRLANIFARELGVEGAVEGNVYSVSCDDDGSVLVKISTAPESAMASSVTLRIGVDGERTVVDFGGVKTNDAFAAEQELAARRVRLAAMLPECGAEVETAKQSIRDRVATLVADGILTQDQADVIAQGADVALQGLLETFGAMSRATGRPDKEDFGDYRREFTAAVGEVVARCGARVDANTDFAKGVDKVVARIRAALTGAAEKCRAPGEALSRLLAAFADRADRHFRQLKSDFYLSGEDQRASAAETVKTLEAFAARIEKQVQELPDQPVTADDVAQFFALLDTELPRPADLTFSQMARESLLARHHLVSSAEIARLAGGNPAFAPVAESVNTFASAVNRLLEQSEAWTREDDRKAFGDLVRAKMDMVVTAVKEAWGGGVAFDANGIEALLRSTFDSIAVTFREREGELRRKELGDVVQAAIGKIDSAMQRGLSSVQRAALTEARARLGEYAELAGRTTTLPTREGVQTLAFLLRREVDRFLGAVFNAQVGAKAKRFFAGIKGLVVNQDAAALFRLSLPTANLAEDALIAANPFGDHGVGSLDELNRLTRATRAVNAAINANPDLFNRALDGFETLDGAERFLEMDEGGNVCGFKVVDGRNVGRELVETAFREVVQARISELASGRQGALVDVDALATPEWKESLLADVRKRLVAVLEADRRVAELETAAVQKPEAHARGSNILGLDVDKLTGRQITNLKNIVLASLLDSQLKEFQELQRQIDEMEEGAKKSEWQEQADAILNQWIREPIPIRVKIKIEDGQLSVERNDAAKPSIASSATMLRTSTELVLQDAIFSGRFSLDDELSVSNLKVMLKLAEMADNGRNGMISGSTATGLGAVDPVEILNAMRLNGVAPADIDRLCSPVPDGGGFTPGDVASMLEMLYLVNQRSVNGLDSLAVRMFGKPLAEMSYAEFDAYRQGHRRRDDKLGNLDPLFSLRGGERKAADFFMRTGLPTTEYVAETRAVYGAIVDLERATESREVEMTYAGRAVTLKTDGAGHLEMVMKGVAIDNAVRDIRFICPLDLVSFRRQLEDEMSLNVKAYGAELVRGLLPDGIGESGTARQLALNVIAGTTGTLATELCNVRTSDVVKVARDLLARMGGGSFDAKKFLADALGKIEKEKVVCFNGEATLESYRRMELADQADLNAKVVLPEQRLRLEGETVAQARMRQVHAFVSELVMPNDTTKYDIERRNGKSESDILLDTLKSHRYELGVVLRTLGGPDDVLDSFSLAAGDAEDGRNPPRMNEMTVALKTHMARLKDLVGRAGGMDAFFQALDEGRSVEGVKDFLDGFASDIAKASDSMLAKMQRLLTDKLTAAFRQSMAGKDKPLWKQTLDEIAGAGTLDVDSGYGQFLMESLATYFMRMEPIDRHRMSSALFRYADSSSNSGQLLGALIKGAGPVLQKLMQGLPQTALPADLREAVTDLKSRLPPIAPEMVRATLLDMVEQSGGHITKIELVRSFGAATVGQTFLCRIYTRDNPAGEECVVKLLRPDVQNRARRERALFLELADKNPTMKAALRTRLDSIFEELDFTIEANNVKQGAVYNFGVVQDGIAGVRSMELYPYVSATANVMVLRKAPGTTYDRYVEKTTRRVDELLARLHPTRNPDGTTSYHTDGVMSYLDAKTELQKTYKDLLGRQRRLAGFIQKWTYEVFFGDGFFHGDLHSGNLMCDDSVLTVIDYGNAQRLTKEERKNLKWALAWIPARDVNQFLNYYREILSPDGRKQLDKKRGDIEKALANIFERGNVSDTGKIMGAIFQVIQQQGVELPGSIFCILQSMQRLDESMRLMNEQLARVEDAFHAIQFRTDVPAEPNAPDVLKATDKLPFIRKIGNVISRRPYVLTRMETLRQHFGEGLTLEQMRAQVNATTPQNVVNALAAVEFFGEDVTLEKILQRLPEAPEDLQTVVSNSLTQCQDFFLSVFNGPDPEPTMIDEARELVAKLAGTNPAEVSQAKADLLVSARQILEFLDEVVKSDDLNSSIAAGTAVQTAKQFIAKLTQADAVLDVEELGADVANLYDSLRAVVSSYVRLRFGDVAREDYNPRGFEGYDDPSTPFGEALQRGSRAFLAELVPQDKGTMAMIGGGVSVLLSGGLTLRSKLRGVTEDEYRLGHRQDFFRANEPWSNFRADRGIYRLEAKAVQNEIDNFRFSSDVLKDLRKGGWVRDAKACGRVKEAMRFNLDNILAALRAKGFRTDVDDVEKRKSLIEYAMMRLAVARPEWFRSVKGVDAGTLSAQLGSDADLQTAFKCLHDIANGRPEVNDELTDEDKREIDEMFRIT